MTVSIKHGFHSGKADSTDPTQVQPSHWNADHTVQTDTGLVGRHLAGTGDAEVVAIGAGLVLDATGLHVDNPVTTAPAYTLQGNVSGSPVAPAAHTVAEVSGMLSGASGDYLANGDHALLAARTVWAAAATSQVPYAASWIPDFATFINAAIVLTGSISIGAPLNMKEGQSGTIMIQQGGAGANALTLDPVWKFPASAVKTLSGAAGAIDALDYKVVKIGTALILRASIQKGYA